MAQQPVRTGRPRPTYRDVQVERVEKVTPGMIRVILSGEALEGWQPKGPAEHLRMWFPQAGRETPLMPEWTDNGPVMPEGIERPVSRVYTPRRWDPEARELEIEIILHPGSSGPGAQWAETAAPGQKVVIAGPAGPYWVDSLAQNFVLLADHSGLPAVETVLEALPAGSAARVFIEVEDAGEEIPLNSPASIDVTWLHAGHGAAPSALLVKTALELTLPAQPRVFVACEATAMRQIRKHLLYSAGLAREHIHTHGYWKQGEDNHPDHDLGDDV